MNRVLQILILVLTLVVDTPCTADTCFISLEEDSTNASAIFVGKVVRTDLSTFFANGRPRSVVTFELLESFKGLYGFESYQSIVTPFPGQYGKNFPIDSVFLVFAYSKYQPAGILWTDDCSLTNFFSKSNEHYSRLNNSVNHRDDAYLYNKYIDQNEKPRNEEQSLSNGNIRQVEELKNNNKLLKGTLAGLSVFTLLTLYMLYKRG